MICPNCGGTVDDGKRFCVWCGTQLAEVEGPSAPGSQLASQPFPTATTATHAFGVLKWVAIIALITVGLLCVIYCFPLLLVVLLIMYMIAYGQGTVYFVSLVALLLFLIALIVAWVIAASREVRRVHSHKAKTMICPNCGLTVGDGERFCGGCGVHLTEAEGMPESKVN